MNILSVTDFPATDDLKSLQFLINKAELLAQGSLGANRSLEIKEYTEVVTANPTIYLSMTPAIAVTTVWRKGLLSGYYGINYQSNEWTVIPSDDYSLDLDCNSIDFSSTRNFSFSSSRHGRESSQFKIKYTSGFDFNSTSDKVIEIKSALMEIVNELQSASISGIKSFEIDDEGHKTSYFSSSESQFLSNDSGSTINELLKLFSKYKPVGGSFY